MRAAPTPYTIICVVLQVVGGLSRDTTRKYTCQSERAGGQC